MNWSNLSRCEVKITDLDLYYLTRFELGGQQLDRAAPGACVRCACECGRSDGYCESDCQKMSIMLVLVLFLCI
jgi:hypothetical protein